MHYAFGKFTLDSDNSKLRCGADIINDDDRIIKTLIVLCESYPDYADKDRLMTEVWADQVVTEWSLSKVISEIRQILGDSGRDQSYIKTIRGKGFRLNVPVVSHAQPLETSPGAVTSEVKSASLLKPALLLAACLLISVFVYMTVKQPPATDVQASYPKQVAVLPVTDNGADSLNDWVRYGVMSLVVEQLNPYSQLQVIPVKNVMSAISVKDDWHTMSDQALFSLVCDDLGCSDLVFISYSIDANLPVLSYRIIKADQSSETLSESTTDIMDTTMLIVSDIIRDLLPSERDIQPIEQKLTANKKANREFAMGIHELLAGDLRTARNYLKLARDRVPDFFWVNAYLAEVEYRAGDMELASKIITQLDSQRLTSEQSYFLEHLLSNILYSKGALEESLATTRALTNNEYVQNNPILLGNEYLNIGSSLQATGNNADAIIALEEARDLYSQAGYASGEGKVLFNLGNVYLTSSRPSDAIMAYQAAREIFVRFGLTGYELLAKHQIASTNVYMGNIQTAEGELRQLIKSYLEVGDVEGKYTAELDLANISMSQNDYAEAALRIEVLIEELQDTEFSYLKNHAILIATRSNLMIDKVDKAAEHYAGLDAEWSDIRPGFALIEAHLLLAQGRLQDAQIKANEIREALGEQWTPAHQDILAQIDASVLTGAPQKLVY